MSTNIERKSSDERLLVRSTYKQCIKTYYAKQFRSQHNAKNSSHPFVETVNEEISLKISSLFLGFDKNTLEIWRINDHCILTNA